MVTSPRDVAIVGAGIVGMSAALYLQRDGHRVTVFDPNEPGSGASFGNAGVIATELSLPVVTPGILRRIPKMMLDPYGPLVIRPSYLPAMVAWLAQLVLATRPAKIASTAQALGALLGLAVDAFKPLLRVAGADDLVSSRGRLIVYSTDAGYTDSAAARAEWARRSIRFERLTVGHAIELEPALAPSFKHALFLPDSSFVANPQAMIARFARAFVQGGGRFVREDVRELRCAAGRRHVVTETLVRSTDVIVIAAGAWSKRYCDQLGVRVPLDTERGYHLMLPPLVPQLHRPVLWADQYIHLVPMTTGVRMTSGVEFAGLDAPPDFGRIYKLAQRAQKMFPTLEPKPSSEWLGFRPSLPDSLPVIGKVPGHEDVILCFGHHHLGLTLGPISGRIVADLVAQRDPPVRMEPYAVRRSFIR